MPRSSSKAEQERIKQEVLQAIKLVKIQEQAQLCVENLKAFLKFSWTTCNAGVPFVDSWHLDCLCDHLEALYRREIRKLIINISPRSYKSGLVSMVFPAWVWLKAPHEKFLCASYGKALALRDSRRCRALIMSQWYQARWGSRFSLSNDQNEKGRFENDKGGFRISTSVEGGVLGEGGSVRLYDDANDLNKMISEPETYPQSVREWYSGTAASRSIDPKTDVQLCVQQRSSYGGDLTEYLLELGGWDQLVIPNEYDGRKTLGPLQFPDPRIHLGDLMCPARLGPEETAILKREQRDHYPGQYNQNPLIAGKSGLKKEWFQFWNPRGTTRVDAEGKPLPVRISLQDGTVVEKIPVEIPQAFEQVVQSWDMTFKDQEQNDYVAGHAWGRVAANCFLIARDHGHKNFPETLQSVRKMSQQFACPEKLVEGKANGPAVIQTLQNEIPGLIEVEPKGGKWSRVAAISGYVEAGNVYLPNPDLFPWVWDLLAEFAAGQAAKHDDDTDAMSQALTRLYDAQKQAGVPEFRVEPRVGEPQNACHIKSEPIQATWRKYIAMIPGRAALWIAETHTGSLRIIRELGLNGMDAGEVGRAVAEMSLPEIQNLSLKRPASDSYEIFLPKPAFSEVEPVGSWAEMMEQALLAWEPGNGSWDDRNLAKQMVKNARFRCDLVEEDPQTALDRLRELLAFAPPDFSTIDYDRNKAFALAEENLSEYHRYMGMVDGKVIGEWPKLRIFPECKHLIAEMGTLRRDKLEEAPPFVETLMLGVSAPRHYKAPEIVARPFLIGGKPKMRNQGLLARKFAMR